MSPEAPRDFRDLGLVSADPVPPLTRLLGFPVSLIGFIIRGVKLYSRFLSRGGVLGYILVLALLAISSRMVNSCHGSFSRYVYA